MIYRRWGIMPAASSSPCSSRRGKVSSGSRNAVAQASTPAGSGGVSPPSRSHAPGRCFNPQPGRDCATSEAELPGFENGARLCLDRFSTPSGHRRDAAPGRPRQKAVAPPALVPTANLPGRGRERLHGANICSTVFLNVLVSGGLKPATRVGTKSCAALCSTSAVVMLANTLDSS